MRKLVTPQRDMVASMLTGVVPITGMTSETERYVRDLYDHLIRISDMVDSYRDLLSGSLDAYMSMVSNRLNDQMKQLTIIATVFLPLSFLTGFFGQNFAWLVNHIGSPAAFFVIGHRHRGRWPSSACSSCSRNAAGCNRAAPARPPGGAGPPGLGCDRGVNLSCGKRWHSAKGGPGRDGVVTGSGGRAALPEPEPQPVLSPLTDAAIFLVLTSSPAGKR